MDFSKETLGSYMDRKCAEFNQKEAIYFSETNTRYSYKQFKGLYDAMAKSLLGIGVKKGDHIAILSYNSPLWIAAVVATAKIGAVLVTLNTSYRKDEIQFVLRHSDATTLLMVSGNQKCPYFNDLLEICPELAHAQPGELKSKDLPRLKNVITLDNYSHPGVFTATEFFTRGAGISDGQLEEIQPTLSCQDTANINYTSGTTGNPKAVMTSHYAIVNNAIAVGENLAYSPKDRVLLCLPLFHVIGCDLSAIQALIYGSALIIVPRFQTEKVLKLLDEEQCTVFNGVPTMFQYLLTHKDFSKYDLSHLKKGMIAGSFCQPALLKEIMKKMHMRGLTNVYGQTEAIGITQTLMTDSLENRLYTIGRPLPGVEAKIFDCLENTEVPYGTKGELCVHSVYLMQGYYKNEEATKKTIDQDGWLHTGDLASQSEDGMIKIVGRIKDIIIRGGENISPVEIEDTLRNMDGIHDVSVVGVPDQILGEELCAFIIPEGDSEVLQEQVETYLSGRLAKHKIPRYVEIVDSFPVTSSGKIKKYILKNYFVEKFLKVSV